MANKDYYSILGVDKSASEDDIKKAFKKMALKYHPDRQSDKSDEEKKEAEEKFKEVNEAYGILNDSDKRRQYDMFGTVGDNMGGGFGDMNDIFRNMSGFGFSGFSGFEQQREVVVNGGDCFIRVDCSLEDVYNGITKKYKYKHMAKCHECNGSGSNTGKVDICPQCHGSGSVMRTYNRDGWYVRESAECPDCGGTGHIVKDKCHKCSGTGVVSETDTIDITIPKNGRQGSKMVFRGKGHAAPNNLGTDGNLIVQLNVKQHDIFGVDNNGYDLYCKTNVNILDCITGCEKTVKCIDGSTIDIKVPQGSKENSKIVVKGKGMPTMNGYGDMIVYINQVMPSKLNSEEEEVLNKLKESKNFKK